ncbi:Receptor-type tyrosine-protein phosphatase V [Psilocybe cubensis]|uniref:protein-tyrosine-phosphatase n=2 Tax=Psilocybe cubensis TaxID=181762 RepID=A0A8H8CQN7_PSICU|nr:Receptor-type tyrosine-protein phosphatase V [Psilocybe cubensis]KAH9486715.1 Receptor-type tyrosine-protein phosphatase V [Psilocybe cubensis]
MDSFAQAIADRFKQSAILSVPPPPDPARPNVFPAIDPASLDDWLTDPTALILDIRPHAAFSAARIPHAISLSVPSTLLKRPLFSLQRLSAMLPSSAARNRFSAWAAASRILVYDADSSSVPDSSNIAGLLRKFKADGFQRDLVWLKGGFHALWRDRRDLIDTSPPTPDNEHDDDDDESASSDPKSSLLKTRHLPMAAFSLSSTTVHSSPRFNTSAAGAPSAPKFVQPSSGLLPAAISAPTNSHPAFNPFFDTIRQNTELSHGITDRIPLRLPKRVRRRIHELPFPWLQDIARRAANAPHHHGSYSDSTSSESEDDEGATQADIEEGKEALAMQFFKIELSEQRRMMGIMEHHSRESGQVSQMASSSHTSNPFPYSITAGVEKGAKNRYRHIWPFEHARVRLHQKKETDDDYINASYIQPLGTTKRYIATQGPLPATFTDFWTLCWEQNVHVIVMLTREVEGAMVKCGAYWSDTVFGPLRLRLVSTEGLPSVDERPTTAGFFSQHSSLSVQPPSRVTSQRRFPHSAGSQRRYRHHHYHNKSSETVKRIFELTHTGYPEAKPRRIVHLQYLEWPDMNVPEDPRGVLGLVKQVEEAVRETQMDDQPSEPKKRRKGSNQVSLTDIDEKTGVAMHTLGGNNPVLLHCSAGVGRTGGFIAVDAILDAIRREVRNARTGDAMDVAPDSHKATTISEKTATLDLTNRQGSGEPTTEESRTIHVRMATPMQVDHPDQFENEAADATMSSSGTMQWAENVRDETGIVGSSNGPSQTTEECRFPSSSNLSFSTPESSNLAGASETPHKHGSYYYNPSSSLGTSVSGSSSYFKAHPQHQFTSDLLQASFNHQKPSASEQRHRTISAPPVHSTSATLGRYHRDIVRSLVSSPSPLHLKKGSSDLPDLSNSRVETVVKPFALSLDLMSSPSKSLSSLHPPMSSDAESPPSRSQSPSADEASFKFKSSKKASSPVNGSTSTCKVTPPDGQPKTFDYKEPRPLHEDYTPPPLTTFDDPIWEVVQDMREQRMSLCQSLRQYVFVHAAIIEGSLMVLDEEKEAAEGLIPPSRKTSKPATPTATSSSADVPQTPRSSTSASRSPKSSPSRRQNSHPYSHELASIASSSSISIGKRGASPTELPKENKEGDLMLSKRPSVKRKQRSGDDLNVVDDARYHPVPVRVTSSVLHMGGVSAPSARAMPP